MYTLEVQLATCLLLDWPKQEFSGTCRARSRLSKAEVVVEDKVVQCTRSRLSKPEVVVEEEVSQCSEGEVLFSRKLGKASCDKRGGSEEVHGSRHTGGATVSQIGGVGLTRVL